MELFDAHRQWATRPADERFHNLEDLHHAVLHRRTFSVEHNVPSSNLYALVDDRPGNGENKLLISNGVSEGEPTHWSFGQLMAAAGRSLGIRGNPAAYLRTLPLDLAADCVNASLNEMPAKNIATYMTVGGDASYRAFVTERYHRIFDEEVVSWIKNSVKGTTWTLPMSYKNGEFGAVELEPSGLYASDRDVFIFMIDEHNRIQIGDEELARGFFVWNSEVGYKSFGISTFLYRFVCENLIVWGAENVTELRSIHVGNRAGERARDQLRQSLEAYKHRSILDDENTIRNAMTLRVADTHEEAVTFLREKGGLAKTLAVNAVEMAVQEEGDYNNLWSLINGVTAMARSIEHRDSRLAVEKQAGLLLKAAA